MASVLSAAWHLGELLCQPEIEESLGKYSLTPAQKQEEILDWIWQPFGEPNTSALPIITGRIAYLLVDLLDITKDTLVYIPRPVPQIDPRLMIPICSIAGIEIEGVELPKNWNPQADILLEQASVDENLERQIHQQVEEILGPLNTGRRWGLFFLSLPPRTQLDLLVRLIEYRQPFTKTHWVNIFKKIEYNLLKSREYLVILIVVSSLSLLSILEIFILVVNHPKNGLSNSSMLIAIVVVINFVLIVWREFNTKEDKLEPTLWIGREFNTKEDKLEPTLWIDLGVLGLWTFCREWHQLLKQNQVGKNITTLFESVAGAGAVALAIGWGLGTWYRAIEITDLGWRRFLSVLAFPWFCWFPLVSWFTSFFLYDRLSWGYQYIVSFWLCIFVMCGLLWWRGTTLAAKARNPLRGILEPAPPVLQVFAQPMRIK